MMIIYTVGHSNRSLQEFIEILRKYSIETVVDVRRFPSSRKYPWYNKDKLGEELRKNNIFYHWLGESLGGYREEGYQEYMKTNEYKRGLERLLSIASRKTIAIMCSEKLWFKCHRRFISNTLTDMGYKVIHIIDLKKTYIHKLRKGEVDDKDQENIMM